MARLSPDTIEWRLHILLIKRLTMQFYFQLSKNNKKSFFCGNICLPVSYIQSVLDIFQIFSLVHVVPPINVH